jgi:hypothetical protein
MSTRVSRASRTTMQLDDEHALQMIARGIVEER